MNLALITCEAWLRPGSAQRCGAISAAECGMPVFLAGSSVPGSFIYTRRPGIGSRDEAWRMLLRANCCFAFTYKRSLVWPERSQCGQQTRWSTHEIKISQNRKSVSAYCSKKIILNGRKDKICGTRGVTPLNVVMVLHCRSQCIELTTSGSVIRAHKIGFGSKLSDSALLSKSLQSPKP